MVFLMLSNSVGFLVESFLVLKVRFFDFSFNPLEKILVAYALLPGEVSEGTYFTIKVKVGILSIENYNIPDNIVKFSSK